MSSAKEEKLKAIVANLGTPEKAAAATAVLVERLNWADIRALSDIAGLNLFKSKAKKK